MRRDIIASVFLFFTFYALLVLYFYPVYYTHGQIIFREVTIPERIWSVLFVLLWIALCLTSAYLKKMCLLVGGLLYGLIPYVSSWLISVLSQSAQGRETSIAFEMVLRGTVRIYELAQAPLVGVSILFEPENGARLSFYLLPVLLASYLGTQLFRFYRNAYLAEQLRLDDISPGLKRIKNMDVAPDSSVASNGNRKMRVRRPEQSSRTKQEGTTMPDKYQKKESVKGNTHSALEFVSKDEKTDETSLEE